jgi:hypothetical protein
MTAAPRFADYEHLLLPSLKHSNGATIDEVRGDLAAGRAHFWPGQQSVAVTHFHEAREMVLWLVGGEMRELFEMERSAEAFARAQGCTRMVAENGRLGWGRALQRIGYTETRVMVKDL